LEVYAVMSGLSYKVSRNGHAGDWWWEVISEREVARGLALTSAQARAEALRAAGSHIARKSDDSVLPSNVEGYKGTLKD
jgi:dihydroxyacetone kinase